MISKAVFRVLSAALILHAAATGAVACPNCKEAVLPGGESVASGFNTSIYFMMAVPILVLAGFGFRIWRAARVQRQTEAAAVPDSHHTR